MIVDMISSLGRSVIKFFRALGRSGFMLFGALVGKPQIRQHFPLLVKQLHVLGVQSLLIILLSGLFIGMVLGLQGYVVLVDFSAETSLCLLYTSAKSACQTLNRINRCSS